MKSIDSGNIGNVESSELGKDNVVSLDELFIKQYPGPCVTGISFYPSNPNNFLTYHNDGKLCHESRFGMTTPPHTFKQSLSNDESYEMNDFKQHESKVTCIDFSTFLDGSFIVGYENGSVRLYHTSSAEPRACWNADCFADRETTPSSGSKLLFGGLLNDISIVNVFFSLQRPSVFYVFDSRACLHVFDLLKNETLPLLSQVLRNGVKNDESKSDESKSGEYISSSKSTSLNQHMSNFNNPHSCSLALNHLTPSLLAVTCDGILKFRPITSSLTLPVTNEQDLMNELLNSLL